MKRWSRLIGAALALFVPLVAGAQEGATITGRVTNEAGAPLAFASVYIEGMGLGTQTRDDGQYSLAVPGARVQGQSARLGVRAIGYKGQLVTITLRGNVTQNFTLEANPLRLGEVVVTGAGTQSSTERLGATISSVKAEDIVKSNEVNVVQALAAKAPGVTVSSSSGEPGASSFIQIRGQKSIEGTSQPLFVVDGVPVDNSTLVTTFSTAGTTAPNRMMDLNPADVESVEILKGAAAAAIYGARAGSGVVLITTKRGRNGQVQWNFRSTYSQDEVNRDYPLQTMYGQGNGGVAAVCRTEDCRLTGASFGPKLAPGTPVYNHFMEMFETGRVSDNSLSVSGGTDRTSFYVSGGYMDNQGIIIADNDRYRRSTALVKGNLEVNSKLRVGASVNYSSSNGSFIQKGSNLSGLLLAALRTSPEYDNRPYKDSLSGLHRAYRFPRPAATSGYESRTYDNPFFIVNEMENTSVVGRSFGNINLDYLPFNWLTLKYTLGADYSSDARIEGLPPSNSTDPTGTIDRGNYTIFSVDHNLIATAEKQVLPWLNSSVTVGQNLNSRSYKQLQARGRGFISPDLFQLSNTISSNLLPLDFESLVRLESYFGEAKFDMWNQLFVTAGVRSDASSTFGKSVRRNYFPKGQVAWELSRTLGIEAGQGILSYAKLRAAYGQTGREPGAYQVFSGYAVGTFGDGWTNGLNVAQAGNAGIFLSATKGQDNLKPERNAETEFGIDAAFFDSRVDLGVTYYDAKSTDVILQLPVPPSTGFLNQVQNAAEIQNKGLEVNLNFRPINSPNLDWSVGALWARNRNLVTDLRGADQFFLGGGFVSGIKQGYSHGIILDWDFARCRFAETENVVEGVDINAACKTAGAKEGAMYIGADGFPIFDPTQRVVGNPQPNWTAGLTSNVTLWKKLQLSALLDIRDGGQMWNGTKGALYNFGAHKDTEIRGQSRTFGKDWLPGATFGPGAGKAVVLDQGSWFQNLGSGFVGPASQFVEDAGFMRLREVSASYTFTNDFVKRSGFSALDLRVSGRNLWLSTDYTGIDPESNLGGATAARGNEYFNNPQARSFVLTVGLKR
ncbi:MAG: SusC/RagA family TonB-linked outer membrane protein [Gemmatimonadetes bacterium]|nr:SusC/RagA family TonB-linked outer membrane protein [Gemmatimonadota bacterium]